MGIKKLVTITVEAQIEIELAEWASNPTVEDIEGVCDCGFYVENSDDIYKTAARLVLNGYATSNNDVFGIIYSEWRKGNTPDTENDSFYEIKNIEVNDYRVESM
ncbi:hypothetical protein [Acinetobacter nematophilus]|uniref:Uncharacterized protein n=1 Tax=Acinetobacter nematophilus TaxID=2994642 RepID=A0A9X3IG81_9GAMM|nr:hypothetical protein [Acinetobacter nematophilus]MCX5466525.1 hypothetical protein [Acinetobacter nematophilus]